MKIASIQLPTLPLSNAKLDYYLKICKKKGVKVVVLPEYVLNSFFKELEKMPKALIKEQSRVKIEALKEFAKELDLIIIAPIIMVKKDKVYKTTLKVSPKSTMHYDQQLLINYSHWNEDKFFDNEIKNFIKTFTFVVDGVKFAILNGFELHFDIFFDEIRKKKIDCLIVPSVGTFNSLNRWLELCKTRAFLNNFYILRANRIGEYQDKNIKWEFYGESFGVDPYGEVIEMLGSKEEILVIDIDKNLVKQARKDWGFTDLLVKKDLI